MIAKHLHLLHFNSIAIAIAIVVFMSSANSKQLMQLSNNSRDSVRKYVESYWMIN